MSRADDFLAAVLAEPVADRDANVYGLLRAVATAWLQAEAGIPSETEANRWSPVCTAAEKAVGIE